MREVNLDPEFDRDVLPALSAYRAAVREAFVAPPLEQVRARARHRAAVRATALTGVAASVVVAAGVAVASLPGPPPTDPPVADHLPPTPVSWAGETILLPDPAGYRSCPARTRVTFPATMEAVSGDVVIGITGTVATGDLTGDGRPEAVVHVYCRLNSEFASGDGSGHLMVVTRDRDGSFTGLAYVGPEGQDYPKVEVRDGALVATIRQRYGPESQVRTYRWDGTSFRQVAGPTAFPG